jgi:CheY-like chemotaxis protein
MPTILVVEDELLIRLHVADYFRDCGFEVLEAADGPQALAMLQADKSVDAVFTDITLPGDPDGCGLAAWIRKRNSAVPVILTSGKLTAAPREECRQEPFFAKPCDYSQVAAKIRTLLARDRPG